MGRGTSEDPRWPWLTGQFISRDPLESVSREPYLYASGDPVNRIDPLGLFSWNPLDWGITSDVSNIAAGWGDGASEQFEDHVVDYLWPDLDIDVASTYDVREALGANDAVDFCSKSYRGGHVLGGANVDALTGGGAAGLGYRAEVRVYSWARGRGVGLNLYQGNSPRAAEWHRFKNNGRMINRPHIDRKNVPGKPNLRHWPW